MRISRYDVLKNEKMKHTNTLHRRQLTERFRQHKNHIFIIFQQNVKHLLTSHFAFISHCTECAQYLQSHLHELGRRWRNDTCVTSTEYSPVDGKHVPKKDGIHSGSFGLNWMRHTDTVRPIRLWAVSWACIANLINRPDALEKSSIGTQKFNAAVSSISTPRTLFN